MNEFGQKGSYVGSRRSVYFNKTALCEGESFKALAAVKKGFTTQSLTLRLFPFGASLSEGYVESTLDLLSQRHASKYIQDREDWYYYEKLCGEEGLRPGQYIAQVRARARDQDLSNSESNMLAEHFFEVLKKTDYTLAWQEAFGGSWDDPVYADTKDLDQLSTFFTSWDLEPLRDYEKETPSTEEGLSTSWYQSESDDPVASFLRHAFIAKPGYPGSVIERVNTLLRAALETESPETAFYLTTHGQDVKTLPHVDLTRVFWLIHVLGSTLADILFFNIDVTARIASDQDSLSISLTSRNETGRSLMMPSEEPPLFAIVRDAAKGTNLELVLDNKKGITLRVNANRSPLRVSVGQGG